MPTRAAAKRELAANMSSPPATPISTTDSKPAESSNTPRTKKRASAKNKKPSSKSSEQFKGNWDILPHGLGYNGDLVKAEDAGDQDLAGLAELPKKKSRRGNFATLESSPSSENALSEEDLPKKGEKKTCGVKDEDFEDLKPAGRRGAPKKKIIDTSKDVVDKANELVAASGKSTKESKGKAKNYGLTPGKSPYPDHVMPTPEACEEVNQLLSQLHGDVIQPAIIPPPSMDVTGCGEVPDALDAILRTYLSSATTANNSNKALQGLKTKFGLRTSGPGKGSVNWEAVLAASAESIEQAIKSGGLAKSKSKNIKTILETVHEENILRRDALIKERKTGEVADITGAKYETKEAKDMEIFKADENLLSMDHIFEMTTEEAMEEMMKLPGVAVKTASCVVLFCMKRPSFAVDTHVLRHCKLLGWVPPGATRDKTFSHCEVRVPDHLKYSLHQLFLKHGKTCGRCTAKGSQQDYDNTICPIENLVDRSIVVSKKAKKRGVEEMSE
jgi:endonuclease III